MRNRRSGRTEGGVRKMEKMQDKCIVKRNKGIILKRKGTLFSVAYFMKLSADRVYCVELWDDRRIMI